MPRAKRDQYGQIIPGSSYSKRERAQKDAIIDATFTVASPPSVQRNAQLARLGGPDRTPVRLVGTTPWEKQPNESRQAYEAFTVYRSQDPSARSIIATAREMGKARTQLGRWSSRWAWVARVQSWDAYCLESADEAARKAVADEAMEIRKEQNVVLRQQLSAGRALMREALRAIQVEKNSAKPDARNLALAGQALKGAIDAQRLATGMPTELTRQDVNLRKTVEEAMAAQQEVMRILEEVICDECRTRYADELGRLRRKQRTITDQLGLA